MSYSRICETLKRYRTELMGIAIIWILFFHTGWIIFEPLNTIMHKGYIGVDIFLFLSGFGIWHSLKKGNIFSFYLRRIRKVYPSYLIVLFLLFVQHYSSFRLEGYSKASMFESFFCNVFMISFFKWTPITFNWYIFLIIYMYILSPLFYQIIRRKGGIPLLIVSILFTCFAFGNANYMMAATRVFIYILGMYTAYMGETYPEKKVSVPLLMVLMFLGIGFMLYSQNALIPYLEIYGLWWYPCMITAPGLICLLCFLLKKIGREKFPLLSLMGRSSLEIYLINVTFREIYFTLVSYVTGWTGFVWIPSIILMALSGVIFHFAVEKVMDLLSGSFYRTFRKNGTES